MIEHHLQQIARELTLRVSQVEATVSLLDDGATIPFIARYRKEATGTLDEVAITTIRDRLQQLRDLDKRREAILNALAERGQLTDELRGKLNAAETMAVLEDIYLPFRPKRRTRATIARERGLEPLAKVLFEEYPTDPRATALPFIDPEKEIADVEAALAGARDIIAEWVSEDQRVRAGLREFYLAQGVIRSRIQPGKEETGSKFRDYFDWQEPISQIPSHRLLAMRRGEKEEVLSLRIEPPEEGAIALIEAIVLKGQGSGAEQVRLAINDSNRRLLSISMETEVRLVTKKRADQIAIAVFAENLRQLLLAPPLGRKKILALDPGFRTGCKLVCLDSQGKLLHSETIYPHLSERERDQAGVRVVSLVAEFGTEAIAVGNGTAGRETEAFLRTLGLSASVEIVMVNESGASVYSASEVAREEFPDCDLTVRGAVSIGRRLMDPLAELVKIDPKAIGVGQYQHDVDQGLLRDALDDVVVSCVNAVGVELNTASKQLLTYVSGLGPQLAKNIVEYRDQHGPFSSREQLKEVPRLGPKAYEQAAGFLRIRGGQNPLDGSAVHPESYPVVEKMAADMQCSIESLMGSEQVRKKIELKNYVNERIGLPTLTDIMAELSKPGRDPRRQFESVTFVEGINSINDLHPGMRLPGVVTNITAFGVFVDIGVHQDGLVHISQLADRYVKNPAEVVSVSQPVSVTVIEVDVPRKRIALSMKSKPVLKEAVKS